MNHPSELKYARTHEWVKIEGDLVITGITDHAQDELEIWSMLKLLKWVAK